MAATKTIRCVYHGWKYDVEGKCVDLPNVPSGSAWHRIKKDGGGDGDGKAGIKPDP